MGRREDQSLSYGCPHQGFGSKIKDFLFRSVCLDDKSASSEVAPVDKVAQNVEICRFSMFFSVWLRPRPRPRAARARARFQNTFGLKCMSWHHTIGSPKVRPIHTRPRDPIGRAVSRRFTRFGPSVWTTNTRRQKLLQLTKLLRM